MISSNINLKNQQKNPIKNDKKRHGKPGFFSGPKRNSTKNKLKRNGTQSPIE